MNRGRREVGTAWAILFGIALLVTGCATPPLVLRPDDPEGRSLERVVDSAAAHALLVELLSEPGPQYVDAPEVAATASRNLVALATPSGSSSIPANIPRQAELYALGQDISMDYAALVFAKALLDDTRSRPVQAAFESALQDGPELSEAILQRPGGFPYTVLFAPGWLYESHQKSGADFATQRRELDRLGLPNRLIPTQQSGSVEDNAAKIADAVREAAQADEKVILVSASKAGADTAYALTRVLAPAEAAHVVAWVNAGGALRGTPLADRGLRPPISWMVHAIFGLARWSLDGVRSMQTEPSSTRFDNVQMPESIAVINLVAIPMSGTVGRKVRGGYWVMRKQGPTDGVVPIAETLWPGGVNIPALGSDHLLVDFRERAKGLALLRAIDFAIRQHGYAAEPERI